MKKFVRLFHFRNMATVTPLSTICAESVATTVKEEERQEEVQLPMSKCELKRKLKYENKLSRPKKVKVRNHNDRPGYGAERFDETEYYFENGLRKVRPYHFTYTTFCKGRWTNRKLLDVFCDEFRTHPKEMFVSSIKKGLITVNSKSISVDYILKDNDFIASTTHRHEVPVSDQRITIVHESDDFLVIDKPASIPVHPCGRYRHNSVVFILGKEYGFRDIRNAHRLDRLTSGLLIFARNLEKDRELKAQIRTREVEKEYLCRVEGNFPSEPIICCEPIGLLSEKVGICRVCPDSKDCRTEFQKVSYNGKSSIVLCKPYTGRMHQIRVHLQYLGYPIVNDPLYNHPAFGPDRGKNGNTGKTDEQLLKDLLRMRNSEFFLDELEIGEGGLAMADCSAEATSSDQPACLSNPEKQTADDAQADGGAEKPDGASNEDLNSESKEESTHELPSIDPTFDSTCPQCLGKIRFRDPKPEHLVMYLHAWKYRGPGWEFQTEIPYWAKEDWTAA